MATDITEHPTAEGKLYCAAVLDAYSRRIIGWSIADTCAPNWSLDALGMAVATPHTQERRAQFCIPTTARNTRPGPSGNDSRNAGLLGSMGSVGDCYDNAMMESFWGTLQLEVLDRETWDITSRACQRHLRMDRVLVQPDTPPFQHRNAQSG